MSDATEKIRNVEGRFVRQTSQFRRHVEAAPDAELPAAAGRYHLYVSYACPWASRTLAVRALRGLEDVISVDVVHYWRDGKGWRFTGTDGSTLDSINGVEYLSELYARSNPDYSNRVTVPVLWDKTNGDIVNNESSEIIRMMNVGFAALGNPDVNLYPEAHREQIDRLIPDIYERINNGVYKTGFASTQAAYEESLLPLFAALDHYEAVLARQRYLVGDALTEADICLFVTLVRFDVAYYGHFKCNLRRIVDYPNLWNYTKDVYQTDGIAGTVNIPHIKGHYYGTHKWLNPSGVVPAGPVIDFTEPHDRTRFG